MPTWHRNSHVLFSRHALTSHIAMNRKFFRSISVLPFMYIVVFLGHLWPRYVNYIIHVFTWNKWPTSIKSSCLFNRVFQRNKNPGIEMMKMVARQAGGCQKDTLIVRIKLSYSFQDRKMLFYIYQRCAYY